jgi:hypothetical protein
MPASVSPKLPVQPREPSNLARERQEKKRTENKKRPRTLASHETPEQPSPEVCSHTEYDPTLGM